MNKITIHINKEQVWNEVAKTANYTGDKMVGDETAYERIMLTDADAEEWQRFWEESASVANDEVKDMLINTSAIADDYNIELEVSKFFDSALLPSVEASLCSYFILSIVSKWYMFCNKGEAQAYATEAVAMLADAMRKLYSRKRPTRPNRINK